jgi:multiple sugar transport system permease protein
MSSYSMTPESSSSTSKFRQYGFVVITTTILLLFAFIQLSPFILTIANSFKCQSSVQSFPGTFIPAPPFGVGCMLEDGSARRPAEEMNSGITFNPTVDGYNLILSDQLPRWLGNTIIFSVSVTILRVILNSLAGYALARIKFPGQRAMFFFVLGILMVPGVVLIIPRFIELKLLGLLGTLHGYIFVLAADAFGIFLMKQFFEQIPGEIEEAASVDGANRLTIFFRIVLPMATPALTALTIFSFQGQWNNFMDALVILSTNQDLYNLPLGLTLLRGAGEAVQFERVLPGSVITTLPMAVIFFFFQRYFVEGVSYSGLKG